MPLHIAISTSAESRDPFNKAALEAYRSIGCNPKVIPFSRVPSSIDMLEAADSITTLGTPLHYSKKTAEILVPYFEPLRDARIKRWLSICAGAQVLGLLFGAEMKRKQEIEIGPTDVLVDDKQEKNLLIRGLGKRLVLDSLHTASLDISNASKIKNIAKSVPTRGVTETGCEAQIIQINNDARWIYGIQSHPERLYDGLRILRNFLDLPDSPANEAPVLELPGLQENEIRRTSGIVIPGRATIDSLSMAA
jgi:anthranilate/para-aminobenzoate synthase component II